MSRVLEEITGRYRVVDNQGRERVVVVITSIHETRTVDGAVQRKRGIDAHRFEDGSPVNVNEADGSLTDAATGAPLRRV